MLNFTDVVVEAFFWVSASVAAILVSVPEIMFAPVCATLFHFWTLSKKSS